jgi:hypothetical protein
MRPVRVEVNDKMQRGYVYFRTKPVGKEFRAGFKPQLTPKQMLELGVFGGKYMTDCREEFPASWFTRAKLSPQRGRASLNYFGVNASQPLSARSTAICYAGALWLDVRLMNGSASEIQLSKFHWTRIASPAPYQLSVSHLKVKMSSPPSCC